MTLYTYGVLKIGYAKKDIKLYIFTLTPDTGLGLHLSYQLATFKNNKNQACYVIYTRWFKYTRDKL